MPRAAGDVSEVASVAIDGGDLPFGGGLLALVRPALDLLQPGGVLGILSTSRGVAEDLPSWCRVEHHRYLGSSPEGAAQKHLLEKGPLWKLHGEREPGTTLQPHGGRLDTASVVE